MRLRGNAVLTQGQHHDLNAAGLRGWMLSAGGRPVGAAVFGSLPASIPGIPAPILPSCNK